MTLNNFIEAIAGKLTAVWPDRKVYVDEIPKDADGQFFVGIIESEQEKHLDRRWKRSIQFEVLYFLNTKENMEFNAWAETMFDQFDVLTVKETDQKDRTVRLTGQKATPILRREKHRWKGSSSPRFPLWVRLAVRILRTRKVPR